MARTKTAPEAILSILRRGPRRGLTASAIAERGGLNLNTTRTSLYFLVQRGDVTVSDTEAPSFGRPANVYKLAG